MKTNHNKLAALGLLVLLSFAAIGFAQTFNFLFNRTDFMPDQYGWETPWTVTELVDFVEVTLVIAGSGYEGQTHEYDLTLKNVASESDYIFLSCDYAVTFEVGIESEILVSGTHDTPILYVGESILYEGTFAPTLFGAGNVKMSLTSILWGKDESISWSTKIDNQPPTGKLITTGFSVTGASKTYEKGTTAFTLTANDLSATFVSFTLKVEKDGIPILTLAEEISYELTKDVGIPFEYIFTCTEGGALTMVLDIVDFHGP